MYLRLLSWSGAVLAPLLFCVLFSLSACSISPGADDGASKGATGGAGEKTDSVGAKATGITKAETTRAARDHSAAATASGQAMDTAFVHRSDEQNSRGDYTYLSDPSIDGDPDAVVLATPMPDQGGGGDEVYGHNLGVWYEPQAQRWAIFNQDRAAVPEGTTFQVVVPGGPEGVVHRAGSGNIDENSTYLDDPLVNGEPGAILSVTQNWNPGGGSGTYNDHPVDVRYDTGRQQWTVFNTDGSAMPDGAAFNVAVSGVTPTTEGDAGEAQVAKSSEESEPATTTEAVLPGDILDEKDLEKPPPKYEDWYKERSDSGETETSDVTAGAIPAVTPFNLGKDPGGPDDKTLYLTVPDLGLADVPVYNSVKDEKLEKSVVHIPATGFPWQKGANTYIAGHRLGYEGTGSYLVFYYLDMLGEGDEIVLEDEAGDKYKYRVTAQKVVDPDNVEVMEPQKGKSLVSLQTCTLPDYKQRLIVQGELVDRST